DYRTVPPSPRQSGVALGLGVASQPGAVKVTPGEAVSATGRTIGPDAEWKYVNVRRYTAYVEQSIQRSLQFTVFAPNGEALWANVRATVSNFLYNEWQNGALVGDKPEQAYFVKCDRSTMTQNDLDNGRLIVQVGMATVHPAEFVVVSISALAGKKDD